MEKLSAAKSGDATPLKARRLRFGRFVFDAENALLTRDGEDVALPPRAAEVLKHLLTHPGEVVPKEALLDAAWNGVAVSEHSLSEAIKVLRRALQDDPREPRYIQTLYRRGFRFLAPVEVDREGPRPAPAPERRRSARLSWVLALSASSLAIAAYFGVRTRGPVELPPAELVARGSEPDSGSLSPDGRMLAFTSWAGGIVVRDLLSGEDTLLDEHGGLVECPPVWSPEGSRLAYGFSENHRWQVRLIDRKVRAPSVVYQTERGLAVTDWSPDGRRLLLVQFPTETNLKASLGELSLEDGSFREMRSFEWVWPPRAFYSPDGSRIAYGSSDGDRGTVHVFDREGGIDVAITHEQSDEGFPLWSPNGRFLLLRSRSDDDWDFWAVALRGLERVGGPYLVQDRAGDSYPWSWAKEGSLLSIQKSQWGEIWTLPLEPSTVDWTFLRVSVPEAGREKEPPENHPLQSSPPALLPEPGLGPEVLERKRQQGQSGKRDAQVQTGLRQLGEEKTPKAGAPDLKRGGRSRGHERQEKQGHPSHQSAKRFSSPRGGVHARRGGEDRKPDHGRGERSRGHPPRLQEGEKQPIQVASESATAGYGQAHHHQDLDPPLAGPRNREARVPPGEAHLALGGHRGCADEKRKKKDQ